MTKHKLTDFLAFVDTLDNKDVNLDQTVSEFKKNMKELHVENIDELNNNWNSIINDIYENEEEL